MAALSPLPKSAAPRRPDARPLAAPPPPHRTMAEKAPPENPADVLEEDDEFEEFEYQDWDVDGQDPEDPTMWQDGWEDDEEDNDFTRQLRSELSATQPAKPARAANPRR